MARSKPPSHYRPALTFHAARAISFISASIVTGILIYFCVQLQHEGFKVPWTFLIILAASVLTLVTIILTTVISCCSRVSPLLNLFLNIPLLILWIVGMSVLAWNIYGTLSHSCTIGNWANNRGVSICQTYKALFAFVIFGLLAHITLLVLDIRARRYQTRGGNYARVTPVTETKFEPAPYVGGGGIHSTSTEPLVSSGRNDYITGWAPRPAHGEAHNYYSGRD